MLQHPYNHVSMPRAVHTRPIPLSELLCNPARNKDLDLVRGSTLRPLVEMEFGPIDDAPQVAPLFRPQSSRVHVSPTASSLAEVGLWNLAAAVVRLGAGGAGTYWTAMGDNRGALVKRAETRQKGGRNPMILFMIPAPVVAANRVQMTGTIQRLTRGPWDVGLRQT